MQDCIFCKIINKQVPSDIIAENDNIIVIKDISPKATLHFLIITKKHIPNLRSFTLQDFYLGSEIFSMAKYISDIFDNAKEFKLVMNNGANAGQVIMHCHVHFLAGRNLKELEV